MPFNIIKKAITATGTTTENEPIVKSDGAGEVMQWQNSTEEATEGIYIREDSAGMPLRLGIGVAAPDAPLHISRDLNNAATATPDESSSYQLHLNGSSGSSFGAAGDTVGISMSTTDGNDYISASMVAIDVGVAEADLAFSTRGSGGITERLRISSAGKVSVGTPSDGFLNVTGSESSKYAAKLINSSSQGWGALVFGGADADDYSLRVVNKDDVDLLVVKGNGSTFVKRPEWPLKNEISNSGFDVWSNSTLEDATGTELVTNGTFDSNTTGWTDASTGSGSIAHATNLMNVVGAGLSNRGKARQTITGLTVGKLYKFVFTLASVNNEAVRLDDSAYGGTEYTPTSWNSSQPGNGTHTVVFEATTPSFFIEFETAGTGTMTVDTVTLKEVTPGCVAADLLACDGWGKDSTNLDIWRQHNDGGTLTKDGSFYSLKATTQAVNRTLYANYFKGSTNNAESFQKYAGRTVTFGAWVKTTNGSHCRLSIWDGGTRTDSAYHGGGDDWEWLEVTKTIQANPTGFQAEVFFALNANTAYISQPMLVYGAAIGASNYSRPSGEIINVEKNIVLQSGVSPLAADDKILNLEALSSGKIPKGAKAVQLSTQIKNSAAASDQGIRWGATSGDPQPLDLFNYPYVSNFYNQANGIVACDSNGDIYQEVTESGATLNSLYQYTRAVHLR